MKNLLIVVLLCCLQKGFAQDKNNIYAGLALSNGGGLSLTYTRKLSNHLDLGGGLSKYNFGYDSYGGERSAVYADLRPHWGGKRSLFFLFVNAGLGGNGGTQPYWGTISRFGVYSALGTGYCFRAIRKKMGPFVSLGIYSYTSNQRFTYPQPPPTRRERTRVDIYPVLTIGFKF